MPNTYGSDNFTLVKSNTSSDYGDYYSVGDSLTMPYDDGNPVTGLEFIYKKTDGSEYLLWSKYGMDGTGYGKANFYGVPTTVCLCTDVQFYDTSNVQDITSWLWDFGDTSTSTDPNPSHQYSEPGVYTVTLTVKSNLTEATATRTNYITVTSPRAVMSTYPNPPRGYAPLTVTFYDNSVCTDESKGRLWDFGDPDPNHGGVNNTSSSNPATNTFYDVKTYPVTLTVKDYCGNPLTVSDNVTVLCPNVNCDFTCNPTSGYALETPFVFQDASSSGRPITYYDYTYRHTSIQTDYGNITPLNTSVTDPTIFHHVGTYRITEKVCNDCGNTGSKAKDIQVYCPAVSANFTATPPDGKSPLSVGFNDYSIGTNLSGWIWDFGDGSAEYVSDNDTTRNPPDHTYYFNQSTNCNGNYTVTLTVENWCGSEDTMTKQVVVTCPEIAANFTATPSTEGVAPLTVTFIDTTEFCMGDQVKSRLWEFGDGNTSTEAMVSHTYYTRGTYQVNLTVTNSCGNTGTVVKTITVTCSDVNAEFSADPTSGYGPLNVTFTDESTSPGSNITGWNWTLGDGNESFAQNLSHIYYIPGTYTINLTATNDCGMSENVSHVITVTCPIVTAAFSPTPRSGPAPLNVSFADKSSSPGSTITNWSWSFGDGNISYEQHPSNYYSLPGEYRVNLTATNACGNTGNTSENITVTCPVVNASFNASPITGYAPLSVAFNDTSTSTAPITGWTWTFGDGNSSNLKNPSHTYYSPGTYTVNLTANNFCGNGTASRVITVLCPPPVASFAYSVTDYKDFTVQFTDTSESDPFDIMSWLWQFGDGTNSTEINPLHYYGGLPRNFTVNLTVTNECGNSSRVSRLVNPNCDNLTAAANATPSSGLVPLLVNFTDYSTPLINISSWRWTFGDGSSYYTTNASLRNTSHTYTNIGTYYATLMIENSCGQAFTLVKVVTVTSPAQISGHLWRDANLNGWQDTGEVNLSGWRVDLERRDGNTWNAIQTQNTSLIYGAYNFSFSAAYGVYRVREYPPTSPTWKVTYSYQSENETVSGYLPIQESRIYTDINFGNIDWHISSMQFPDRFKYGETDGGLTWTDRGVNNNEYWEYTTSYNDSPTRLWNPADKQTYNSGKISYVYYQVPPHEVWADSSFNITPSFYMRYLIIVNQYGYAPITATYWLKYWIYDGTRTDGFWFNVPDNTNYTANKLMLYFVRNDTPWSSIYVPYEGEERAYSKADYLECHFTGTSGSAMTGKLISPTDVAMTLTWQPSYGYYTGYWNNTRYEGQNVTLVTQVDRGSSSYVPRYVNAVRNATIGWEPVSPVIKQPANKATVSGNVTVNATVGGKNRDTGNVSLIIGGKTSLPMTWNSITNNFTATWDAEPYAGKNLSLMVRASPLPGKGKTVNSTPVYVTVKSTYPLVANFSADPWTGPSRLEVAFTDLTTGGPNWWKWTFGDGNTSSLQNPVYFFNGTKNYSVTLQVKNITSSTSSVSKWVNVSGQWHDVTLLSSRNGFIPSGSQRWIVQGSGSSATIDNTTYTFQENDTVRMNLLSNLSSAKIFMAGILSHSSLANVSLVVNSTELTKGNCTAIHIADFVNYHSDINLTAKPNKSAYVSLVWDGALVTVDWRKQLDIYNLVPTENSYMDMNLTPGNIFFTGRASSYSLT
ncbi:MAG: PKD domain-containing protein [Methanospirillum sp.]|nr:PKD domain-containing protein [Methanospirillum sp.]